MCMAASVDLEESDWEEVQMLKDLESTPDRSHVQWV